MEGLDNEKKQNFHQLLFLSVEKHSRKNEFNYIEIAELIILFHSLIKLEKSR